MSAEPAGAAAPSALFYHLGRSGADVLLPQLLSRALGQGWRVAVRGTSVARLRALDDSLWLTPADSFLPHGMAGGPWDAEQPVLLTTGHDLPNGAVCVIAIDSAAVDAAEAVALARVCVVFDGNDLSAVSFAREQWKAIVEAGVAAQYWNEEAGRWQLKSDRPGRQA